MPTIESLQDKYEQINRRFDIHSEREIDPECLLTFDYKYAGQKAEVVIDTHEFTAVCPWTGLPDFGTLEIRYIPDQLCIELKSLKYYILSYSSVGIVQEHAANQILNDLVATCKPSDLSVSLDYNMRGGLHTSVTVQYEKPKV